MATKEAFLQRLADKFGRNRIQRDQVVHKPVWQRHPWDHLQDGFTQQDLVDQFCASFADQGGQIVRLPSLDAFQSALEQWLIDQGGLNMVTWNHKSAIGDTLLRSLQDYEQGNENMQLTIWDENADPDTLIQKAEQADVGFAIAEHGLAETGTAVLYNRGNCGRLVSLLPPACVIVVSAQSIIPRLTQLLPFLKEHAHDYSCINLITGPSRSGDIEMTLSTGVHGPGEITIFLIEDHNL